MPDEKKAAPAETYDALMQRLQTVVERLETGELSLEESLRQFEDGIKLVRRGEELLGRAEQRIEELLSEGGEDKVAPLPEAPGGKQASRATKVSARAPAEEDDDVPF